MIWRKQMQAKDEASTKQIIVAKVWNEFSKKKHKKKANDLQMKQIQCIKMTRQINISQFDCIFLKTIYW